MRILIADDEAIIRLDLQELLQELGHEVVSSVGNGLEAIEQARLLQPDLLILDIKMPVMDGLNAAQALMSEDIAPVILLTAYSDKHLISKAGKAGVYAYLVKPFSETDIATAISIAVARHKDICDLKGLTRELQQSLTERKLLEKAKGVLVDVNGISEEAAFAYIRKQSQVTGKSMTAVARSIVGE